MTMLFVDGCQYNAALTEKWSAATSASYSTTTARTGNRSIRLGAGSTSGTLTKTFGSSYGTLSVGWGGYMGTGANFSRVQLLDSAGANQITVNIGSTGTISVYRGSEAGTLLGTGGSVPFGSWFHLEFDVTVHDSTGAVDVYLNGASVISVSGVDTKNTAVAGAASVKFTGPSNATNPYLYIDDVVITNTFAQIGAAIVQTLYPTGAGATTQWTPSAGANYAAVDETTGDGDTTYVSTSTLNNIDTYAFGDLTANSGAVLAVAVNIVGRADAGGSPQVTPVLRPGSTDRLGTGVAQTATYANGQSIWETNPDGGSWTEAAVNASEAGIKKTV
jgi:hypothetical protein